MRSRARQLLASTAASSDRSQPPADDLSWDSLYRNLKRAFPPAHYHHATRLIAIRQDMDRVYASLEDGP